ESAAQGEPLAFSLNATDTFFLMPIEVPVPGEEADEAVRFSISSLGTGWKLPAHRAHLIATVHEQESGSPLERLSRFTRLLAATIDAVDGVVGVYWGAAHATHEPRFFRDVGAGSDMPAVMLW